MPRVFSVLLFAAFAGITLSVYQPALNGPFISDDIGYFSANPYTAALGFDSLIAFFDPTGAARLHTANYAPVHLLLTAVLRQIFANDVTGYHLINVLCHAFASWCAVMWLMRAAIPVPVAVLGGFAFALHPANVEAVAWISQLKTTAAFVFALGALMQFPERPRTATLLFALGLLTKASAAAALPAAAAFAYARARPGRIPRVELRWLGGWCGLFALYALAELGAQQGAGEANPAAGLGGFARVQTIFATGARYVVMSATGFGLSAYHEPDPIASPLDPWFLAGVIAAVGLGLRAWESLRARRVEAGFWAFALASFLPVSQLAPFVNPVADRYVYFILPGLLGAALCYAHELWERYELPAPAAQPLGLAALVVIGAFAWQSLDRAALWKSEHALLLDAEEHYPRGGTAAYLEATRAAQRGDAARAVAELRRAEERNAVRFSVLLEDPGLAPLRGAPEFRVLLHEMAGRWIERSLAIGSETQPELRARSLAHRVRGEDAAARAALERAIELGGPLDAALRGDLAQLGSPGPAAAAPAK
jgi:hypothetical protein